MAVRIKEKWDKVNVKNKSMSLIRQYSETSGVPITTIFDEAIGLWNTQRFPLLIQPFQKKDTPPCP